MAVVLERNRCVRLRGLAWLVSSAVLVWGSPGHAQETIDVGVTGFAVKRPVLASACPNGCPWGEIGEATGGGGCAMNRGRAATDVPALALALALLFSWRRRAGKGGARGLERTES